MPITAARFSISVDGYEIAVFSELQGIATQVETVDYVESRDDTVLFLNRFVRARPPVSLKLVRPRGSDTRMSAWNQRARANPITGKKNCILALYEGHSQPVARYHLENAWPSKFELGGFTSGGGGTTLAETVTLVCDHLQRVSP